MPAKSIAQQQLFGMALAVRRGEMKRSEANDEVLDIVDSDMTDKEIEDFASTKHKGLKKYVKEMKDINEYINESFHDGGSIFVKNAKGKMGFMMYDSNSGTLSAFSFDKAKDLIDDFGYDESEAEKIADLKVMETYEDKANAIYCRIW